VTISRVCYVTREQVARAPDFKFTARLNDAVDRAIESASDNVDGFLNRRFFTAIETNKWDWPNWQYTYPWRLWLDEHELADTPTLVTTGSLGTPITIPSSSYTLWPYSGPPYRRLELRLDRPAFFGGGPTPQQDISITGPFGYWLRTKSAGVLAVAMNDTVTGLATVSNGSLVGVGDQLIVGSERMLVQEKATVTTTQTNLAGLTTDSVADAAVTVTDGTKVSLGEVLLIDSERLFVYDITGNVLLVKRGWDGTILATHNLGTTLFAYRVLTVTRGDFGTTAATHSQNAAASVSLVPPQIRDLALAEAVVQVTNEPGAYASMQGGEGAVSGLGASLADKWEEAEANYGRKTRKYAI